MARQITTTDPPLPTLEHRVALLEQRIAALAEATRLLAAALDDTLPGDNLATRQAHQLLHPPPEPTTPR